MTDDQPPARLSAEREAEFRAWHREDCPPGCDYRALLNELDAVRGERDLSEARADALAVQVAEMRAALRSTHGVLMPVELRDNLTSTNARLHAAIRMIEAALATTADPAPAAALLDAADALANGVHELHERAFLRRSHLAQLDTLADAYRAARAALRRAGES